MNFTLLWAMLHSAALVIPEPVAKLLLNKRFFIGLRPRLVQPNKQQNAIVAKYYRNRVDTDSLYHGAKSRYLLPDKTSQRAVMTLHLLRNASIQHAFDEVPPQNVWIHSSPLAFSTVTSCVVSKGG